MERNSELVLMETDPMQFIRFCKYDLLSAAQRLCRYWTERKSIFGPDRAFLPFVLSGDGALTPEDLHSFRSGFSAILPDTIYGQKCILSDRLRRSSSSTLENFIRCLYRVLAEDPLSQTDEINCLMVVHTLQRYDMDLHTIRRLARLNTELFPVSVNMHVLFTPQTSRFSVLAMDLLHSAVEFMRQYLKSSLQVHIQRPENTSPSNSGNSLEGGSVLDDLMALGFTKKGIPEEYGGTWTFRDFTVQWYQERLQLEQEMYAAVDQPPSTTEHFESSLHNEVLHPTTGSSLSDLHIDANSSRPRAATLSPERAGSSSNQEVNTNAKPPPTYASRPPEAAAAVDSYVQNSGSSTTKPHSQAKAVSLPDAAGQEEQQRKDAEEKRRAEERLAKRRRADVIRSRRKRERERQLLLDLQNQSAQLDRENKALLEEQDRLERLVADAEQCVAAALAYV